MLDANNTLDKHPEWVNSKRFRCRVLATAELAQSTRNILSRHRLNLHVWDGYHEILLNRLFQPGSIGFDFWLRRSCVDVMFNRDSQSFSAIRFSSGLRPGADQECFNSYLQVTTAGKFLMRRDWPDLFLADGRHTAQLLFQPDRLDVFVDHRRVRSLPATVLPRQMIGFRGGPSRLAMIGHVAVTDATGATVITEDFSRKGDLWRVFKSWAAVVIGVEGMILGLLLLRTGSAPHWLFLANTCLCGIAFSYLCFDSFFWSRRYPYQGEPDSPTVQAMQGLEAFRKGFFGRFDRSDASWPRARLQSPPQPMADFLKLTSSPDSIGLMQLQVVHGSPTGPRMDIVEDTDETISSYLRKARLRERKAIVLLGTSQMWGAGASRPADTIQSRLCMRLCGDDPGGRRYLLVNGSICGSESGAVIRRYEEKLIAFRPVLVIADFSNNDLLIPEFAKNLDRLIRFNKDRGIKTAFVLEASHSDIDAKRSIMKAVALKAHIPCIDLNRHITEAAGTGNVWEDGVHLTGYGQDLAAGFIYTSLLRLISRL